MKSYWLYPWTTPRIQLLFTASAATTLMKVLLRISHLDYFNSLLTGLPASTLDPPYICFQHSSQSDPLKVNQIMSLLCPKPCNDSPSHSAEKPVFTRVYEAYIFCLHYLSTSFPTSSPAHCTPHRPPCCSWKYQALTHFKAFKWLFPLPGMFNSYICIVYALSLFMSLFKCYPLN